MFLILAIFASIYLFYKWATSNNEYFVKKGIPFDKPAFLLGSNKFLINKMARPDIAMKWYHQFKNEK